MARAITPPPPAPPLATRTQPTPVRTSPTTAMRDNAATIAMPVCRRIRAARAAMPASAMTALGGPMTPRKHIQASQDAAAMNARRGGSAPRASKNRQTGNRGARGEAGVPSGSAAVVVEWDGVAMCYPVRQRWAPPCGRETTRSRFEITSEKFWAAWLSQTKPFV